MDGAGTVLDPGVVEVEGGRIAHVGPEPTDEEAEARSARGLIVVPGLVNTHCHLSQQLGRGLADDVDLLTWLRDRIWPYEAALDEEDVEVSALACALEQIRNGVTTIADPGGQHVDGAASRARAGRHPRLPRPEHDGRARGRSRVAARVHRGDAGRPGRALRALGRRRGRAPPLLLHPSHDLQLLGRAHRGERRAGPEARHAAADAHRRDPGRERAHEGDARHHHRAPPCEPRCARALVPRCPRRLAGGRGDRAPRRERRRRLPQPRLQPAGARPPARGGHAGRRSSRRARDRRRAGEQPYEPDRRALGGDASPEGAEARPDGPRRADGLRDGDAQRRPARWEAGTRSGRSSPGRRPISCLSIRGR